MARAAASSSIVTTPSSPSRSQGQATPASTPAGEYGREGRYLDVPAMPECVYGTFTAIDVLAVRTLTSDATKVAAMDRLQGGAGVPLAPVAEPAPVEAKSA